MSSAGLTPITPISPVTPTGPIARPALAPEIVGRLFMRMGALYGSKFNDQFLMLPKPVLSQMWAEELASYSIEELSRGINGCRTHQWPPTLPEFMLLCRPPLLPLHPEEAYHEALANLALREQGQDCEWRHPAVYHAAMELTAFELRRQPWHFIKARWYAAFARHLADPDCPPVPPRPQALARPATRPPNETEKAAIARLRGSVGVTKKPLTSFRVATPSEHPDDAPREAWNSPLAAPFMGSPPQPFHAPIREPWLTADTDEDPTQEDPARGAP